MIVLAVFLVFIIYLLLLILEFLLDLPLASLCVSVSSVFCAFDLRKIIGKRLSAAPFLLFLLCSAFWPVVFPLYLLTRRSSIWQKPLARTKACAALICIAPVFSALSMFGDLPLSEIGPSYLREPGHHFVTNYYYLTTEKYFVSLAPDRTALSLADGIGMSSVDDAALQLFHPKDRSDRIQFTAPLPFFVMEKVGGTVKFGELKLPCVCLQVRVSDGLCQGREGYVLASCARVRIRDIVLKSIKSITVWPILKGLLDAKIFS